MRQLFALAAVLQVVLSVSIAHAMGIGISPVRLELNAIPGQTIVETVTIFSSGAPDQQVRVILSDFTLGNHGKVQILPPGTLPTSDTSWMTVDSTGFVLPSGAQRKVRISVTVPSDGKLDGTYNGMVFFRVVPAATNEASGAVGVTQTAQIGLAVYVTISGTERTGSKLQDFFQDSVRTLDLSVANTGNTLLRLNGDVELRGSDGATKYVIPVSDVPVLRASQQDIIIKVPPKVPAGYYVALAVLKDSRGGVLTGQASLNVK